MLDLLAQTPYASLDEIHSNQPEVFNWLAISWREANPWDRSDADTADSGDGSQDSEGTGGRSFQRPEIAAAALAARFSGQGQESGIRYSLSHKSIIRLEEAIARKMNQGPEERAAYYEKLRDRLASTVLMLRESKRNDC